MRPEIDALEQMIGRDLSAWKSPRVRSGTTDARCFTPGKIASAMAKVSVIIPVYNGAATIGRALASVFAQTFTDYEVVVVNDGSTDDTASVLAGYGDRIRVVTQANRGLPAARNSGIRASSGEYVAFIDDDDEWLPQMLERCAAVLDQDPDCGLVYARSAQGRPRGEADARPEQRERGHRFADDGADARASMGCGTESRHGASGDPRAMRRI